MEDIQTCRRFPPTWHAGHPSSDTISSAEETIAISFLIYHPSSARNVHRIPGTDPGRSGGMDVTLILFIKYSHTDSHTNQQTDHTQHIGMPAHIIPLKVFLVPSPLFLYVHDKGQIRNIMKRNISNTILTKDYIFSKVSQITIFSTYTGISVEDIQHCIDTGEFISSPFREDTHPSFGFRYDNRNKLKGRDFAGYWWGDCIDAAATVLSEIVHKQIDISIKSQFLFVLKHIAYTFRNIIYGQDKDENNDYNIARAISNVRNHKPIIELVTRPWNNLDAKYWGQFGINFNFLNTHFVYPVDQFYINRSTNPIPKYFYDKNKTDLC